MDVTISTGNYSEFECLRAVKECAATAKRDAIRKGSLLMYVSDAAGKFKASPYRRANMNITKKGGKNLSSVFVPDASKNTGYGDVCNTDDALLFVFHDVKVVNGAVQQGGIMEIFVARGQKRNGLQLCQLLAGGELDDELNALRSAAR